MMLRLPRKSSKVTAQSMNKFLKLVGVSKKQYQDWIGCMPAHSMKCWFTMNPDKNMRDWGMLVKDKFCG